LEGKYSDKVWDGAVEVRDRNIKMDILGRFDLSDVIPEFDFTMNLAHANLYKLRLVEKDTEYRASALLTATFTGNNIDNLDGDLRLINSTLRNSNGEITIYDFMLHSGTENGIPLLTIRSDFADGEIRGQHTYASIGTAVKAAMAGLFPTRFKPPATPEKLSENNFTFNARFKQIDKLSGFFNAGITVAEGSTLSGYFYAESIKASARFFSPSLGIAGAEFRNLTVNSSVSGNKMNVTVNSDSLHLPDNSDLRNFIVQLDTRPDSMNLAINWDNRDDGRTLGDLKAAAYYGLNNRGKPVLNISIIPTEFVVTSTVWRVNPGHILVDSTSARFDDILLSSRTNYLRLDGVLSSNPRDKLTFSFEGLNLAYLNNLNRKNKKEGGEKAMELSFGGILNGNITLSDVFDEFLFESDITVRDFLLNNSPYGQVTARSEWNPQKKVAVINVKNDLGGSRFFDISGTYDPAARYTDVTASALRLPLNSLNSIVKTFASDVRGTGSGKVNLKGKLDRLFLTGAIKVDDASMKVDFLQTRYSFSDSVRFTRKGIEFRKIRIYDEKRNQGQIDGILAHNSFNDFRIDLNFDMNNMLVLNTKPKDNEIFYGTAYASGYAGIKGSTEKLAFNISARTEKNTEFFVPLNSSATVSEYPYIIFIDTQKENEAALERENMFVKNESAVGMELNFDLEVTPDAEVQLIMDSKAGDVIRGTGSGKLNISMSSRGGVKMAGDYVIEDGDYLFTLGNILNKRFSVDEGGTISWNGALEDAVINLRAVYRLKTSLYDLFPDEAFRERIPVECRLSLTEKLINPVVGFDISLPTADDETQEYLKMAINTEEELSRQFLYLLVMNSFYPDPALFSAAPQTSTQGASAIGVTTTEMLTNQFSNWLSQISNDFDIGFAYRPGNEITPQELEVALSTQLLNDKVVLNGTFDVGGKQSNTQASNISGDFDIEFKITEKLRFKVFNRANDNLFYKTAPYTQGFGIFLRRDFDRLKDLFIRPETKKKKKPEAAEVASEQ
ncbi:MAG TPA: translocation/assembly module TamB domain-containing protein, partial [Bacteroidales bacterium]|nr:translocation/assembly module TamB domain-containing protein [Bacteroidales bacterium]